MLKTLVNAFKNKDIRKKLALYINDACCSKNRKLASYSWC